MRCFRWSPVVLGIVVAVGSAATAHEITRTINVTATVATSCRLDVTPLTFPLYDPADARTAQSTSVPIDVMCNAGAQPRLRIAATNAEAVSAGSSQAYGTLRGPQGASLLYRWELDAPASARAAAGPLQWTLRAALPAGQAVPDGSYNGTLVAVLEF